ncbi:hypothetical protein ACQY1Z_01045 [Microcystis aeruginosa FBCC-A68]|uniref:hypothetical protein n=1 Tax=Microcystis aeruginosa TaxID=1126 RepID=UPI003D2CE088
MGKWGSGEVGCRVWGSGEVGKWGSGEVGCGEKKAVSCLLSPVSCLLSPVSCLLTRRILTPELSKP